MAPLEDPSVYPRVYRASGRWLIALILCGSTLALGGIFGTWFLATAPLQNPPSRFWLVGLCLALALLGFYCVLSPFRSGVRLFADRIEVEELTRALVLSRDEIRGWRSLTTSPPTLIFIPRDASRRSVKLTLVFRLDPAFEQWLDALPCLDIEDARASIAGIQSNPRLGATASESMKSLAKGKRVARIFAVLASLAALWGFVYPRPYKLVAVILAVLPWVAVEVVRRSGGLFRVDANRNDAHPNVAIAFIFPGAVLALRSVSDYNIVYSLAVVVFTICIGGFLCLSAFAVDPSVRPRVGTMAGLLAFSLLYGYGTAIEANALLDHSPEANYSARVEAKRTVKGNSTTYELELGAWGPRTKSNKLRVARATYNAIERGDVVYLILKRGALGVNWYFMRQWQRGDHPMPTPTLPPQG